MKANKPRCLWTDLEVRPRENGCNGGLDLFRIPVKLLSNTIFARLVIMHLVVVLPIIVLGIYLYNWSYKNAVQEISRNKSAQLASYLQDLNREIEWLEVQQFDMLQESRLHKIAVIWDMMDNIERRENIQYLLNRLTSIQSSSAYIKDICVHIRTIGKTISADNGVYAFDREKYDYIRTMLDAGGSRLIKWNGSLHLGVYRPGGNRGAEPVVLIQIELDPGQLKESLRQISVYPESGSFLIAEEAGFMLAGDERTESIMQHYTAANRTAGSTMLLELEGRKYHVDQAHSDELGLSVVSFLPSEAVKRPLGRFNQWAWLFTVASLIAVVVYAVSTYRFVHRPLLQLVRSFRRIEGGDLDIRIEHKRRDEFGYLYNRFNLMLIKLQSLIEQDFKQKLMMQKAELKQLQSQINPHFLYNSFFILNTLARTGDTERIELFTNMLGEYFRFITRDGADNVWLAEEIKHARMYTEIQKLRFSRRIRVQFDDLPKEMERIRVPRLIVQPIIENAYEHSLEKKPDEGFLRVTFAMTPAHALIVVEDNGNGIRDDEIEALKNRLAHIDESREMTGMMNIHRRIVLTYGEGSGLFPSRSGLNGLKIEIRIGFGEANRHVQTVNRG